uniref:Bifunctional lysine-specific demethylase and histidyl-hydroxylase n=1 Tax=Chenopodium quinoa TaxID=63459 RepID=A0A803MD51_CHEQI
MDAPDIINSMPSEVVIGHIFGPSSTSFTNFMLEHWESSPFLIRNQPKYLEAPHAIFSSFMHSLTSEEALPKGLSSILREMVSCPPVALNEIDCLSLLNDVRDTLGSPIIYQQDIRLVKTSMHSKLEEHYFQECSSNGIEGPRSFSTEDILKCEGAYREGYTTAVRGMEFRNSDIAAVTRVIASMFGQLSVGANLYVTPPDSQGLSCHYDDHCVFVCQLYGAKQWTVYPKPIIELPRLYECLEVPQELLVQSRQILLTEGDVLYLPRGFAHEACTVVDLGESSKFNKSSVHLTLAIEVEPPFDVHSLSSLAFLPSIGWEGFAHIALYLWSQKKGSDTFAHDASGMLSISVNILHVAMRLLSSTEPVFRKACLAAASSLPIDTIEWHEKNQRATFKLVSDKINELCSFTDSLEYLQKAVERDDDPFHWLRWLQHLNGREVHDLDQDGLSRHDNLYDRLIHLHHHHCRCRSSGDLLFCMLFDEDFTSGHFRQYPVFTTA